MATEYAKVREQFGRPIATFQAVKHHCANMLVAAELATAPCGTLAGPGPAAVTSSATPRPSPRRSAGRRGRATPTSTSRCTAGSGSPGSTTRTCTCAGPTAIAAVIDAEQAAIEVTDLVRARRAPGGRHRAAPRGRADPGGGQARTWPGCATWTGDARKQAMIESGYAMPHWPKPWGRDASADRAAGDRAGVRRRRDQAARLRHHQLDHPHPDPARQPGPGGALGAARRSTRT